jgi:hypothetical protein
MHAQTSTLYQRRTTESNLLILNALRPRGRKEEISSKASALSIRTSRRRMRRPRRLTGCRLKRRASRLDEKVVDLDVCGAAAMPQPFPGYGDAHLSAMRLREDRVPKFRPGPPALPPDVWATRRFSRCGCVFTPACLDRAVAGKSQQGRDQT